MARESGVYYYLTDNSLRVTSGSLGLDVLVPMLTLKGPVGVPVPVDKVNFKDILGYDLAYNPNYLGLSKMLDSVASVKVLRLNKDARLGNMIVNSGGATRSGLNFDTPEQVQVAAEVGNDALAVAYKWPGDWGRKFVSFVKTAGSTQYSGTAHTSGANVSVYMVDPDLDPPHRELLFWDGGTPLIPGTVNDYTGTLDTTSGQGIPAVPPTVENATAVIDDTTGGLPSVPPVPGADTTNNAALDPGGTMTVSFLAGEFDTSAGSSSVDVVNDQGTIVDTIYALDSFTGQLQTATSGVAPLYFRASDNAVLAVTGDGTPTAAVTQVGTYFVASLAFSFTAGVLTQPPFNWAAGSTYSVDITVTAAGTPGSGPYGDSYLQGFSNPLLLATGKSTLNVTNSSGTVIGSFQKYNNFYIEIDGGPNTIYTVDGGPPGTYNLVLVHGNGSANPVQATVGSLILDYQGVTGQAAAHLEYTPLWAAGVQGSASYEAFSQTDDGVPAQPGTGTANFNVGSVFDSAAVSAIQIKNAAGTVLETRQVFDKFTVSVGPGTGTPPAPAQNLYVDSQLSGGVYPVGYISGQNTNAAAWVTLGSYQSAYSRIAFDCAAMVTAGFSGAAIPAIAQQTEADTPAVPSSQVGSLQYFKNVTGTLGGQPLYLKTTPISNSPAIYELGLVLDQNTPNVAFHAVGTWTEEPGDVDRVDFISANVAAAGFAGSPDYVINVTPPVSAGGAAGEFYKMLISVEDPAGGYILDGEPVAFSLTPEEDTYWKNVSFGDYFVWFKDDAFPVAYDIATQVLLGGTSNGKALSVFTADDMDLNGMEPDSANIVAWNQFSQSISLINKMAEVCHIQFRSFFYEPADFDKWNDDVVAGTTGLKTWQQSLFSSEYSICTARPDTEETPIGLVTIGSSVNYVKIYARMFNQYGHMNFPPAGYTYGSIAVTKLQDANFDKWGDEMKTFKVNRQKIGPKGPVMWEIRTRYALESDLSNIHCHFILREIRANLIEYAGQFLFRFATASDLNTIGQGIEFILAGARARNFLTGYSVSMPSFGEVNQLGGKVNIEIHVAVISVIDEIVFNVFLERSGTL